MYAIFDLANYSFIFNDLSFFNPLSAKRHNTYCNMTLDTTH